MIDLASIGLRISARLANKLRQKYGVFDKFQLSVIGAYGVANKPHVFLTRANQHVQESNRHFNGTFNHFGPMVFAANQEHNESYKFKDMLFQLYKLDLILARSKRLKHMKT